MPRVLAICLDGYEESLGREFMDAGQMPGLARLAARSRRFLLDHGPDLRTGLAGEHFATGQSPARSGRWAAVHFDPLSYAAWQEGTSRTPFPTHMSARTVAFDPPYFDLQRAPQVQGVVNWGAHDPGVAAKSRPDDILATIRARFGPYPARDWIYGTPWGSADASREMGSRLAESVRARADIATWLLSERLPDWDLAIVTVSEAHSAIEGLWHGVDTSHPLHGAESAQAAGDGVRQVYREIDQLVARLCDAFPDAAKLVFSLHGMGPNRADVASMLLLPELLYRHASGDRYFVRAGSADPHLGGCPSLGGQTWDQWVRAGFRPSWKWRARSLLDRAAAKMIPTVVKRLAAPGQTPPEHPQDGTLRLSLGWMPATRYQRFWHRMLAFAVPSFYDGRIRINLQGRERNGLVRPNDYHQTRERLAALLHCCTDPISGQNVVEEIEFTDSRDPTALSATEADMVILWRGAPLGFDHPDLGRIGPVPYRRTGGHTGSHGFLFLEAPGLTPEDCGIHSAYDVVPTLFELLGEPAPNTLSGAGLMGTAAAAPAAGA